MLAVRMPMVVLERRLSVWAERFGTYPSSAAAASTRALASSETPERLRRARDTV